MAKGSEINGVFFGKKGNEYIIKPEDKDGHVLVVGGVGSGKSSCVVIPTLRGWKARVFAIDIKGELYNETYEYRKEIKVFDPKDPNAYSYNPYFFLEMSPNKAQEALLLAEAIIPLPPDTKDPFWIESAQAILTGAILYYYGQDLSFIETLRQIQLSKPTELIKNIVQSDDENARMFVNSFSDMEVKTLSGICTVMSRAIVTLVTDDDLVNAFAGERSITPNDLESGYDIYIKIPEYLLRQWKHLFTLMVNQFLTFFERREEKSDNVPILFMLDEFPRLGKIPAIIDGLATLRAKKISICLVVQNLSQIDMVYGEHESAVITGLCDFKAVLNALDYASQKKLSDLVGTHEVEKKSKHVTYIPYTVIPMGHGGHKTPHDEPRIKPHEFANLKDIVLITGYGFFRVNKVHFSEIKDIVSEHSYVRKTFHFKPDIFE